MTFAHAADGETCTSWHDSTTYCYVDDSGYNCVVVVTSNTTCSGESGTHEGPPRWDDPSYEPRYPEPAPGDENFNGVLDDWSLVVNTGDPCAYNFDSGDRLGADRDGNSHNGVDIQGDPGDAIYSLKRGIVERVGDDGTNCGYSVRIGHRDGSSATYCHMQDGSSGLFEGQRVRAGSDVGAIGNTGNQEMGYHLHLIYRDESGTPQEYFYYLDGAPPSANNLDPEGC